jgi:hypothetical protein
MKVSTMLFTVAGSCYVDSSEMNKGAFVKLFTPAMMIPVVSRLAASVGGKRLKNWAGTHSSSANDKQVPTYPSRSRNALGGDQWRSPRSGLRD